MSGEEDRATLLRAEVIAGFAAGAYDFRDGLTARDVAAALHMMTGVKDDLAQALLAGLQIERTKPDLAYAGGFRAAMRIVHQVFEGIGFVMGAPRIIDSAEIEKTADTQVALIARDTSQEVSS